MALRLPCAFLHVLRLVLLLTNVDVNTTSITLVLATMFLVWPSRVPLHTSIVRIARIPSAIAVTLAPLASAISHVLFLYMYQGMCSNCYCWYPHYRNHCCFGRVTCVGPSFFFSASPRVSSLSSSARLPLSTALCPASPEIRDVRMAVAPMRSDWVGLVAPGMAHEASEVMAEPGTLCLKARCSARVVRAQCR